MDVSPATDQALRFDRQDRVFYLALAPGGQPLQGDTSLRILAQADPPLAAGHWRFSTRTLEGEPVRLAQLGAHCGPNSAVCQMFVAETLHKRDSLQRQLLMATGLVLLMLCALLMLAGWGVIWQGLQPVQRLGQEVERRDLDRLDPLDTAVPAELSPLIAAFNRLFTRLSQAAAHQREFLANAAHQLRTPLTALRTEIDLALLEPHDPQLTPLLQRLQRGGPQRPAGPPDAGPGPGRGRNPQSPQALDLRAVVTQVAQDWVTRLPAGPSEPELDFELQPARCAARPSAARAAGEPAAQLRLLRRRAPAGHRAHRQRRRSGLAGGGGQRAGHPRGRAGCRPAALPARHRGPRHRQRPGPGHRPRHRPPPRRPAHPAGRPPGPGLRVRVTLPLLPKEIGTGPARRGGHGG
jgi:two-component system sensor histidine kinase TctE